MFVYVVSDGYDILGVYDKLNLAKIACDIKGYDRIDQYKLNHPKPIKCWLYYNGKWEEYDIC